MSPGSITRLFNQLQLGDRAAAQKLWELYFHRLVGLARTKLGAVPRGTADEEDVALSAFDSFCRAAEQGRFPQLADRNSLWRLLMVITARKAAHQKRDAGRQKRGGGSATVSEADEEGLLNSVLSREPDPAFAAEVAEQSRALLNGLANEELRQIALRKMEGYTNEEIAAQLGFALATVERRLRLIRKRWEKELPAE
jgi:DNA-directed RNA polymerase specialized sigma24 family protein